MPPDEDGIVNDYTTLDTLVEIQEADNFQRVVQEELDRLRINERGAFDLKWLMHIPSISQKDLDELWEEELKEAKEIAAGEECMEEVLSETEKWLKELRDMMTPEEKEQEAAKTAENQRRMSENFHRKYGWAKVAMKNESMFFQFLSLYLKNG